MGCRCTGPSWKASDLCTLYGRTCCGGAWARGRAGRSCGGGEVGWGPGVWSKREFDVFVTSARRFARLALPSTYRASPCWCLVVPFHCHQGVCRT